MAITLADQEKTLGAYDEDDEDELEEAEEAVKVKVLIDRLLKLIPENFPPCRGDAEPSVLCHDDLSMGNILVGDDGAVTGVIDWEFVSFVPLWRACVLPQFLEGRHDRHEKPDRAKHQTEASDIAARAPGYVPEDDPRIEVLDNEGMGDIYWEHCMEYDLTKMRKVFLEEMERLAPEWKLEYDRNAMKMDIHVALMRLDNDMCTGTIEAWLDNLEKGEHWRLAARIG